MKVGDLIEHKWGKNLGVVVGKPDPARQPPPDNWYVFFSDVGRKLMVHEQSCKVLSENR
tara:strand:+ start:524 stop:700 length:177 start_codon:yes stop_codon:yes gene_type:complete